MSHPNPHPSRQPEFRQLRHLELLIALISILVLQSFVSSDDRLQRVLLNAMFLIVVLSAMRSLACSKIRMWATIVLGVAAYALSWIDEVHSSRLVTGSTDVCFIAIFVLLISSLAEHVFGEGPVDANRIIGAISIYFLIGLAWAFLYALIELIDPGSFQSNASSTFGETRPGFVAEFIYFSNVTLTTLGYGDVTPVSRPARMLATLQAMIGQLYVAIVIARLVGLQISQATVDSTQR
ncbi:Ion channel [Stieleria neptunia]|uniref:Ion channel n=1 Tax=Stieleria neptunia TaxID=2527979 RepID=A0A518I3H5_9BACT|nr:potassium channel family protein [Stieleria neptunia]QDV47645.1 Ion channel [Stieleria neptunia]